MMSTQLPYSKAPRFAARGISFRSGGRAHSTRFTSAFSRVVCSWYLHMQPSRFRLRHCLAILSLAAPKPRATEKCVRCSLQTIQRSSRPAMVNRQATLKYVKTQQTLGCARGCCINTLVTGTDPHHSKFFGKPNGSKPAAPQQTKLAFSQSRKTKAEAENEEDGSDVEMKNVKDEKVESADEEEIAAKPRKSHASNARKRTVEESDDADEMSEIEPPAKKQRGKNEDGDNVKAEKDTPEPQPATATADQPKAKSMKKTSQTKGKPQVAESTTRKSKGKNSKRVIQDDDDDASVEPQTSVKSPGDTAADKESDADEDETSAESDLEEMPEVAAKARAKVQTTLTAIGKDPYPDWKPSEPVPFAAVCTTFSKIEMTTKRLEIAAHCSLFLRQVLRLTPDDLLPTVMLMINKLAADYAGIELGIGESLIMKAIGESTGRSLADIKADQNKIGDLGLVAAKSRSNQPTMFKPKPLTARGVWKGLMDIATVEGQGAQGRKVGGIKKLLSAADANSTGKGKGVDITTDKGGPSEAKYIVRMLEGKLRLGLAERTVIVALAQAVVFHETSKDGNKLPSTAQLEKGEKTLKSVYRYDILSDLTNLS